MPEKTEDKISIYKLDTPEEILDYYKNWSSNNNYEKDLEDWNYVAPHECCHLFVHQVQNKNSLILDAGCGTGLVGKILQSQDYTNLEGLDFSQEMLDLVPANIYQKIFRADLNQSLSIHDSYYDHALCVGTFTYGHVKANAFAEFHRILKNNAIFIFSINEGVYESYNFGEAIANYEKLDKWKVLSNEKKVYKNFCHKAIDCPLRGCPTTWDQGGRFQGSPPHGWPFPGERAAAVSPSWLTVRMWWGRIFSPLQGPDLLRWPLDILEEKTASHGGRG